MPLLTEEDLERSRRIRAEHEAAGDTTYRQNRDAGEATLVAHAGVVNGWRQNTNGAALPPAQGGPSFSPSEMQVLSGGQAAQPPIERLVRPEERTVQPAMSGIDLDAMKKELGASLSSIDTREALEDAKKNLDKALAPESEDKGYYSRMLEKQDVGAPSSKDWKESEEFVKGAAHLQWQKAEQEARARKSKDALKRTLSGARAIGPKISDDEAFGAEDAMIISSSTISDTPPPF